MKKNRIINIVLVAVLFACGSFARLWKLGASPFRADTMDFYRYALEGKSIVAFWLNPPWLNQIPLNETFTLFLIKIGLPPTAFVTRLPFAVMGILTLFLLWRFVQNRFGVGAAACVLVLAVFNPFQIYYARSAYHYAGATCWSAAMFMVFWRIRGHLVLKECPPKRLLALWAIVAILACHMHMSVWVVAGIQGLLMLVIGIAALRHNRQVLIRFILSTAISGLVLAAAMSRWIYRAVLEMKRTAASGGHIGRPIRGVYTRLFPAFFAGENILAILLLIAFALITIVAVIASFRRKKAFFPFAGLAVLQIGLLGAYVWFAGRGVGKVTYFSAVWPLFICFVGVGLWQGAAVLATGRKWLHYSLVSIFLTFYIALTLQPVWAIMNIEGKLMPTFKIDKWGMTNLPRGTPVLVDRWLHPWNELSIHNTNQINYTFTVPDEPFATFRALRWRETAAAFFERHPQAAFLEVCPGKYHDQVGTWPFLEQNFARVASITNDPAAILHKYSAYPFGRSAMKGGAKRYRYRIFHNTTADILAAAREEKAKAVNLYGEGWGYLKPWQPMPGWPEKLTQLLWMQAGMYADGGKTPASMSELQGIWRSRAAQYINQGRWADYRVPSSHSTLRLYNLTQSNLSARIQIVGFPLSGGLRCRVGETDVTFPQGLMSLRNVTVSLQPGETRIPVSLSPKQILLVHDVRVIVDDATE